MKPFIFVFSIITALSIGSLHAQQAIKIAVVDLQKAFNDFYKTKEADSEMKSKVAAFEKERQEMANDLNKIGEEAKKMHDAAQDKTLSEAARAEKQKAFEAKAQDFQAMQRKFQEFQYIRAKELEDRSQRIRQSLIDDITKTILEISSREKFTLVFDKSGKSLSGTNVLLYAQDVKDITDEVIRTINATKPQTKAASTSP
ncbi:OmpH family outer membrane protein [Candidatus Methylacidiphilum infernorum]|uniref:OmpH family outer membrane protein n=1 Tax=Candidatus Methylacidiphilum infernorum TaxID=511746 RepID=A0ABX7PV52_9BACT|nr:OmpH family outer membrane protein [Candidatus Methylacidiphilum infernorum]QSR86558.1 OmpH family outer membrane protein [Candidatus Methylacidiphilum infernorum]